MIAGRGPAAQPGWVRRSVERLNIRFALVLAVALLPLGVVSLMQTRVLQREIQQRTEAALLGETLRSASGEIGTIRNTQGVIAGLSAALAEMPAPETCATLMKAALKQLPDASFVAYVPKDGMMTCSSTGTPRNFADDPHFQSILAAKAPNFIVNRNGPMSGTSILVVSNPVWDAAGSYQGFVSASLPHTALQRLDASAPRDLVGVSAAIEFWTFDQEGEVLTASSGLDKVVAQMPHDHVLTAFADEAEHVFQDVSNSGNRRTYAVVPIVKGQLYLMSSWDQQGAGAQNDTFVSPYLPAITMWIAGLIVAALASERLVTRYIRTLHRSILRFARGNRGLEKANLKWAPVELREVHVAFESMTRAIAQGETELEDSIHQKEVLLREVHHRVKNNLQLIASIMNIQMRKAIAPEAKVLLRGLQDRVMSLATIHRGLYQTSGLADVRADELFRDIVRQIVTMGSTPGLKFDLSLDMDELHLPPDQAVPLSLLLTEAMTNALKYAGTIPGEPVEIMVRLKHEADGMQLMQVINTLPESSIAPDAEPVQRKLTTSTGLGDQLLKAFSQQIGGTLTREVSDRRFKLSVRFKVQSLAVAETPDDEEGPAPEIA